MAEVAPCSDSHSQQSLVECSPGKAVPYSAVLTALSTGYLAEKKKQKGEHCFQTSFPELLGRSWDKILALVFLHILVT